MRIASSSSWSRRTSAMPPLASVRRGKAQPAPTKSSCTKVLSVERDGGFSVDLDAAWRAARDLHAEAALQRELPGCLGLDGDVAVSGDADAATGALLLDVDLRRRHGRVAQDRDLAALLVEHDLDLAVGIRDRDRRSGHRGGRR